MATGVCSDFSLSHGLYSFRAKKLIAAQNASQSVDKITLDDTCDLLEEERSEANLALQAFDLGSPLQAALEVLVYETNNVEEEEGRILTAIAMETRRLEELEFEVCIFFCVSTLVTQVRHKDPGSEVATGTTEGDGL
jgi:hypothetical protein